MIELNDTKYRQVIFDLLLKISVEQEALKMFVFNEYAHREKITDTQSEIDSITDSYSEIRASAKQNLILQIKNIYGLEQSVDDLLNSAF